MVTDGLSPWEMAALVDQLEPSFDAVLVSGIARGVLSNGFAWFAQTTKHPKLGIVLAAVVNEALSAGVQALLRTDIYALDNRDYLLGRRFLIANNLLFGAPARGDPLYALWMKTVNDPEY